MDIPGALIIIIIITILGVMVLDANIPGEIRGQIYIYEEASITSLDILYTFFVKD